MRIQTFIILAILALSLVACEAAMSQKYSETVEQSFTIGNTPTLEVNSFAGDVTVHVGEVGTIHVVATKRSAREKDLDRTEVDIFERDGRLEIHTEKPTGFKNISVDLDITVPAGTFVDVRTGAGEVNVSDTSGDVWVDTGAGGIDLDDVSGAIDAHTGAGSIDVRDAVGNVRLDTGAGSIDYEGRPQGMCRFESGAGSIKIRLPDDVNVRVDLDVGVGDIDVDFDVDGDVSNREVKGIIGNGDGGEVRAHTGAGDIDLRRQ